MSINANVLVDVGKDFNLKVARVVPGAICYGIYLVLMGFLIIGIFSKNGFKARGSNIFLLFVTLFMFSGGTIFLSLDVTDLVRRIQIIMVNHPEQVDLNEKLNEADNAVKRLLWTGEILFVFMLILGDSVVVWRTWTICFSRRAWVGLPIATWVGSVIAALFELGCDVRTHWAINDLTPSAASVGAEKCAHADLSSYTLSYVTNIFCTVLIAYQSWEYRRLMKRYLGTETRKTQVGKILTLIVESGSIYIILYTLQAVPIYDARLTPVGNTAFNIVNAVFQQAIGIYPTVIIILVKKHKSLWEAAEIAPTLSHSHMSFVSPTTRNDRSGSVAVTSIATGTVVSSIHDNRQANKTVSSEIANKTGGLEKNENSSLN